MLTIEWLSVFLQVVYTFLYVSNYCICLRIALSSDYMF